MVTAFLLVVCEPAHIHDVARGLADTEGIAEVYTTTGSADFVAVVRVADLDALATLVTERITTLAGDHPDQHPRGHPLLRTHR